MKSVSLAVFFAVAFAFSAVDGSVFLPQTATASTRRSDAMSLPMNREARHEFRWQLRQQERSVTKSSAMAIPGYGVAEQGALSFSYYVLMMVVSVIQQ